MKKFFLITLIFFISLQAQAFEELVLSADEKISDIKIEDNSILNIYPLTTILNEKNILFLVPQKTGNTSFSLLKEGKKYNFDVKITESDTDVAEQGGFEILPLDNHPIILDCDIDIPPIIKKNETINIDGAEIEVDSISEEDK